MNGEWNGKCYNGKSTRRVTKEEKSEEILQKQREEMKKEAKNAAWKEYFRECLGFTEFKDVVSDEIYRPIKV